MYFVLTLSFDFVEFVVRNNFLHLYINFLNPNKDTQLFLDSVLLEFFIFLKIFMLSLNILFFLISFKT